VNGSFLDEPYLAQKYQESGMDAGKVPLINAEVTVAPKCFYVLGDNRDNSSDSRVPGVAQVPVADVEGKVFLKTVPGESFWSAIWAFVFKGDNGGI
jgi:signal peptidase I